jgi:hypothetical protein
MPDMTDPTEAPRAWAEQVRELLERAKLCLPECYINLHEAISVALAAAPRAPSAGGEGVVVPRVRAILDGLSCECDSYHGFRCAKCRISDELYPVETAAPVAPPSQPGEEEADDETCTGCWGTGWNGNMEQRCDCQGPAPSQPGAGDEGVRALLMEMKEDAESARASGRTSFATIIGVDDADRLAALTPSPSSVDRAEALSELARMDGEEIARDAAALSRDKAVAGGREPIDPEALERLTRACSGFPDHIGTGGVGMVRVRHNDVARAVAALAPTSPGQRGKGEQ